MDQLEIHAIPDLFEAVVESSPHAILIADDRGSYVHANPAAGELFGLPAEQLVGKHVSEFVHAEQVKVIDETWADFRRQQRQVGEFSLVRPDGTRRTLQYHAVANIAPGLHLSILQDVTEAKAEAARRQDAERHREHLIGRLKELVGELEKERDLRDGFVSALTHDLRTPLTAAKLTAQLLTLRASDNPELQRQTRKIASTIERADAMIRDLLDASLVRAGQNLSLDKAEVALEALARETLDELAGVHGDRFRLEAPAPVRGHFDGGALRRVLENLAQNAVKYGAPGTPVTVRVTKGDGVAVVRVHNQGNAIPPQEQATLFQPFHRTQTAQQGRQKGWGLGLTLVKGIVEAHGGKASLERSDESGTTFCIQLPLSS
jgi:PAS domain S-box-containing protein